MESLAVVAYSDNPELVKNTALNNGWFSEDEIQIIETQSVLWGTAFILGVVVAKCIGVVGNLRCSWLIKNEQATQMGRIKRVSYMDEILRELIATLPTSPTVLDKIEYLENT